VGLPIDDIVAFGRLFSPRAPKGTGAAMDDRETVRALFDSLDARQVRYLLVGGVALLSYVEGRNTEDIDLIVDEADLDKVDWVLEERNADFARASFRGLRVDLRLTANALFAEVRASEATTTSFGERTVHCATREGMLLLKLYALPSLYRQGKLARAALYETDVLMLHQGVQVDDERLLARLAAHLPPTDLAELRAILAEQRARRRFVK
jgi:hypothetical protein